MGKKVLNVIKKVFGGIFAFFCIVEVALCIYYMSQGEIVQNMITIIIIIFFLGVPAFFLLKPSKKTNPPATVPPSDQPDNPTAPTPPPNTQNNFKVCAICGKKLSSLSSKIAIADGAVCHNCLRRAWVSNLDNPQAYNVTSIRAFFNRRAALINSFSPTKRAGALIEVDENHKLFKLGANLFEYSSLLKFELIEDGYTVLTGGLGQAYDDGLFLINSRNLQGFCKSLQLRVILTNAHISMTGFIFIASAVQKNSSQYKEAQTNAQSCVYLLRKIIEQINAEVEAVQQDITQKDASQKAAAQNAKPQTAAAIDEFEKLYQLLHSGLITQEEFDTKKKQLLGL